MENENRTVYSRHIKRVRTPLKGTVMTQSTCNCIKQRLRLPPWPLRCREILTLSQFLLLSHQRSELEDLTRNLTFASHNSALQKTHFGISSIAVVKQKSSLYGLLRP